MRTTDRRAAATVEHSEELDVLLMDEMEAELAPIMSSETQPDKVMVDARARIR